MTLGLNNREVDPKLNFKIVEGKPLMLVLYVDDLFLIGVEVLIS